MSCLLAASAVRLPGELPRKAVHGGASWYIVSQPRMWSVHALSHDYLPVNLSTGALFARDSSIRVVNCV